MVQPVVVDPDQEERLGLFTDRCGDSEISVEPIDSGRAVVISETPVESDNYHDVGVTVIKEFVWPDILKLDAGDYFVCLCIGSKISRTCESDSHAYLNHIGRLSISKLRSCLSLYSHLNKMHS